jgi:hypothetical protein
VKRVHKKSPARGRAFEIAIAADYFCCSFGLSLAGFGTLWFCCWGAAAGAGAFGTSVPETFDWS